MPLTGIPALAPRYDVQAPPSIEHKIPATPLAPAAAVAVTNCVPAVVAASVGPDSEIVGRTLSTLIVSVRKTGTCAASVAPITRFRGPLPYAAVSTGSFTAGAEH